jgi:transcriptional antiterminator NusG
LLFFHSATIGAFMWYVLHTAPRCEPQVAKLLGQQGLDIFLPRFPPMPRSKLGSVRERRPRFVFPGYLFFRTPTGFSRWDGIRWAPGVRRILQQDSSPGTVADEVLDHLRRRLAEGSLRPFKPRFKAGDALVIERGPLAAVDAIFDRELDAPGRVQILVQMMSRLIPIRIDEVDVRRIAG